MLEGKRVIAIRGKARRGRSIRTIARDIGVSRNTVRRYLRRDLTPGAQVRPHARRLNDDRRRALGARVGNARRWDAAGIQRWFADQGVLVSIRTLRRAMLRLRQTRARERRRRKHKYDDSAHDSARDDMEVVRRMARRLGAPDHDELESELTLQLVKLLPSKHKAKNWKALLGYSLWRKALTWLKRRAQETKRLAALDAPIEIVESETITLHDVIGRLDQSADGRLALKRIRRSLQGRDSRVLDALAANGFSKVDAAIELGLHRNSIDKALRRIRKVVTRRNWLLLDLC